MKYFGKIQTYRAETFRVVSTKFLLPLITFLLMKKLFTLGGALLFAITAWADSYSYLVFQTSDSSLLSCDAATVHITFAGEEAVVRDANGEHRLSLASLTKMK